MRIDFGQKDCRLDYGDICIDVDEIVYVVCKDSEEKVFLQGLDGIYVSHKWNSLEELYKFIVTETEQLILICKEKDVMLKLRNINYMAPDYYTGE